jgi:hypothetical protein
MNTFPADEQRISEVERGCSSQAIVPLPQGNTIAAGDNVLFALSHPRAGQRSSYVKGGDSALVCLTDVTVLGKSDPASGLPLVQLTRKPLGQGTPLAAVAKRGTKSDSQGHRC